MKLIIPMAGMGTRMRPHTLNTPKPLLKMAGRSIVERIVEDLWRNTGKEITEVHFIVGNFGDIVEKRLLEIAAAISAKGFIHYQTVAKGTAHAIYCAEEALEGEILISFADTLFMGDLKISDQDAIIWTKEVDNPEKYGVVLTNREGIIIDFIEKPSTPVSRNAIIGIYYFRDGNVLRESICELIRNKETRNGEFQLTDSLKNLVEEKLVFKCKIIEKWLDCGNKDEFLSSNRTILEFTKPSIDTFCLNGSKILEPVYLGIGVTLKDSLIGPYVSIEDNTVIRNSTIKNSMIGNNTIIDDSIINNSLIGNYTNLKSIEGTLNIGDYNEFEK